MWKSIMTLSLWLAQCRQMSKTATLILIFLGFFFKCKSTSQREHKVKGPEYLPKPLYENNAGPTKQFVGMVLTF